MHTNCHQCKKQFEIKPSRLKRSVNVFCSISCRGKFTSNNSTHVKECKNCKSQFKVKKSRVGSFCSRPCLFEHNTKSVKKDCLVCQKPFIATNVETKKGKAKTCSRECANIIMKKTETRKCANRECGNLVTRRPSEFTSDVCFCSRACRTQEFAPAWMGGLTEEHIRIRNSQDYAEWRKQVFERDGYKCVHCGDDKGGNLEADHIKPFSLFPEERLNIENGRTLCKPCHIKTPTYGARVAQYKI
jgi:5-methylcytosine-specific restriction endonuclease McrA